MNRYFLTTITIVAITAMAFTACNRGSGSSNQAGAFDAVKTAQAENAGSSNHEEQNDLHEYSSHQKIVPAFAGYYVNDSGNSIHLEPGGIFVMRQDGNSWENEIVGVFLNVNNPGSGNYFHWTHPAGDFGIYLVPAGVDFFIPTDTTKMRLITENLHTPPAVYYREGELPPVTVSNDLVIGTWMFVSGSFVYFFGQSPSIQFLPDKTVNVHEQGDQYLRIARSGIWGFTPEGQLFVEFDWNTYLFTFSSDGEELIIIDSEGDRGVFGKVHG